MLNATANTKVNTPILTFMFSLCLFSSLITQSTPYVIYTEIKDHYSSTDIILLHFNQYNYTSVISIDLNSSFTWLFSSPIGTSKAPSDQNDNSNLINDNINIEARGYNLTGKEIKTGLNFRECSDLSIDLHMYRIITVVPGFHGSFALGHRFTNDKYSIVHQYYNKGYIDTRSFSLIKEAQRSQFLYLGEIPNEYTEGRYQSYCNAVMNKDNWSCDMTQITMKTPLTDMTLNVTSFFYFNSIDWYIYCPSWFMDEMIKVTFKEEFGRKNCFANEQKPKRLIICANMFIDKKGNITFTIGDYMYTQQLKDYWYCGEELCRFGIREHNEDQFAFGTLFYQRYNILFEYDKHKVSFYSFNNITRVHHSTKSNTAGGLCEGNRAMIKSCMMIIMISLVIGIIMINIVLFIHIRT